MNDNIQKEKLTEDEVNQVLNVWDFLEFSRSYKQEYYNGLYTPSDVNTQMQNINMNPTEATIQGIENALKNPKRSEEILRNFATSIELQNMYYKRLIRYFSDLPCFNITFDVMNLNKDSELNSREFKKDLKILDDFCNKFNFKEEFAIVLRQLLRQGVFYSVLRQEGDKYTLQELPADYCQITGRHSYGLLFDFNFQWFTGTCGTDINMYPKVFKKMYNHVLRNMGDSKYKASDSPFKRNSTFMLWQQCSPQDGFWCWKIAPELATIVPYFSPLFPELSSQPIVRKLQEDKYFIEASKLLVGIIGFNKENKGGQVANQINMTPDMLGKFLGVARKGLNKQIGLTALPMDSVEVVEFNTKERNMLTEFIDNIASQSTSSSQALWSTEKLNAHQSKLASAIDANFVKSLYPMFENFVEYYVNTQTKKYKFKITFHDVDVPDDKEMRMTRFSTYASMGIVDFQELARVYDINPFELNRRLSISNSMGFDKKLTPLLSLHNQSAQQADGGISKPKLSSDNDNTMASDERLSNELK